MFYQINIKGIQTCIRHVYESWLARETGLEMNQTFTKSKTFRQGEGMGLHTSTKRRLSFCLTTTALKIVLFSLITLMFIWVILQVFEDREARFQIIILDKKEHIKFGQENGWIWTVNGFEYFNSLKESPLQQSDIVKSTSYAGLWVFRKSKKSESERGGESKENFLRLTEFQYSTPKEVMVGLKYYIGGSGRIEITMTDALSENKETLALIQDEEEDNIAQGFCSKIITPGFDRLIDMIEIRAITLKPNSIVAIDKVILTVADGDSSRSLMYSLMPNQWCEVKKQIGKNVDNVKSGGVEGGGRAAAVGNHEERKRKKSTGNRKSNRNAQEQQKPNDVLRSIYNS